MSAPLRVALADDQALVRAGLRALLERQGIEIVFEADGGDALLEQLPRHAVDVVLSDIRMPGIRRYRCLAPCCVRAGATHPGASC